MQSCGLETIKYSFSVSSQNGGIPDLARIVKENNKADFFVVDFNGQNTFIFINEDFLKKSESIGLETRICDEKLSSMWGVYNLQVYLERGHLIFKTGGEAIALGKFRASCVPENFNVKGEINELIRANDKILEHKDFKYEVRGFKFNR